MRALPTGTVTFLFTDIEGSTRLLQELGERYADVLAEHRRVLRATFARHGGVEVDTQGDAFFVAFARAGDAVAAAEEAQAVLVGGPVRVRMGIHTGEPLMTDEGYVGVDVHRAARIMSAGHGGQVLVSRTTRDLLDIRFELRDLGQHRLKDLTEPQQLYQLGNDDFPPLKTLHRTNLPVAATPLLGRDTELRELVDLLRNGHRVVTVTSAGGSGKTRLALQAGAELVEDFQDGAFWVPLAGLDEPELVLPTVAQRLGAKDDLGGFLADRRALLLLDNFEHLLEAAVPIAELLASAPAVRALVTSRAPLRIDGEREYPLDPLGEDDAVTLFRERARAAGRSVEADSAVVEICRRLDGLPLALELAAARAKLLEPGALLARLERRLPVLTTGRRDAPERQRTLRGAIEWSYDLLDEDTRRLFGRLAVFAGNFSVEAAEEVCGADLDTLATLVDFSLLKPIGEDRFLLLATIREFAFEQLEASGDAEDVAERHARFFLALAEEARPHVSGGEHQGAWLARLDPEVDNLRAALAYFERTGESEKLLRLATAAWWFWWARASLAEPRHWLQMALERYSDPTALRADALEGASYLAFRQGDRETARALCEERLAIYESIGDDLGVGSALLILGNLIAGTDLDEGERLFRRSLELVGSHGYSRYPLSGLGMVASVRGDHTSARAFFERCIEVSRRIGDERMVGMGLASVARTFADEGDPRRASEPLAASIEMAQALGDVESLARLGLEISAALIANERPADAVTLVAAAAAIREQMGTVLLPFQVERHEKTLARGRELLSADEVNRAWERGRTLTPEQAAELALAAVGAGRAASRLD